MTLNRTNLVLAGLLAVVVVTTVFVQVNYSRPNFQIALGNDMTYSPAYGAYAPNVNFADGRTMQRPVPGTLARGEVPLRFEATPEDALRAGQLLANPFQPDSDDGRAATERGALVYRVYCTACHGAGGGGDGPVAKRGFPPPPSLLTGKSVQMKDGQLFHILTYGQASMPQFAVQLDPGRRWDVIQYIRSLQSSAAQASPPPAAPDAAPAPAKDEIPDAPAAANGPAAPPGDVAPPGDEVPPGNEAPAPQETESQP